MIGVAAVFAAVLVYLLVPPAAQLPSPPRDETRTSALPIELTAGGLGFLLVTLLVPQRWWLALIGLTLWLTATWTWRRAKAQRAREVTVSEIVHGCSLLAGQLRVGQIPAKALQVVASEVDLFRTAWVCQQVGGEVPAALAEISRRPGAEEMAELARAWQLCEVTGASLSPAVQRVNAAQRVTASMRRTVNAELAAAKATGRLLACLPVFGIGFGFIAGGNPLTFLTQTIPGQICLCLAVTLACAGLVWTEKLSDGISARSS